MKVPVSEVKKFKEFETPHTFILKVFGEKLKNLDITDINNMDVQIKEVLIDYLINKNEELKQLFEQLKFERVISISSYNFILEALFYATSY